MTRKQPIEKLGATVRYNHFLPTTVQSFALTILLALLPTMVLAQEIGRIDIRGVSPRAVAADTSGYYDQVSSGLNVVGVGEKVYLEARAIGAGTLQGSDWEMAGRPTGSTVELSGIDGLRAILVPDVAGLYLVRMTPLGEDMEPAEPVIKRVYAGVWVGAGVFNTHETPNASIPSCANSCCHESSDQEHLNVVSSWLQTKHANKLQAHLQGEYGTEYDESCLACHTLGFRDGAMNGGFDDIAAALGYDLAQITALVHEAGTTGVDNWPLLPAELQRHASVQCESCHGPGSQHLGFILEPDAGIAGVNLGTSHCAQCHDTGGDDYGRRYRQWENSAHPLTTQSSATVAGNNTCRACHTGEGFVYGNVRGESIPQMANSDYHGATCSTCHSPHGSEYPNDLRVSERVTLPSGDVYQNAGKGALCMSCHNSRSADAEATALNSFRGAHYGPQGEMLLGTGMATFGLPVIGNSAHSTIVNDTCVACHGAPSDSDFVGGHTFAMRHSPNPADPSQDIINAENACASCHSGLTDTYDYLARGDYDGDGQRKGIQSEVRGLLELLQPGLLALPGTSLGADGSISTNAGGFAQYTDDQKRALYNYNLVAKDGSLGVHNTSFAIQALQRSYFGVYGRSILDDFPNIDLRGPVQAKTIPTPTPTATPIPPPDPGTPPTQEFLAEVALKSVTLRDVSLDETGEYTETASGLRAIGIGELVYMEAVKKDDSVIGYNWSILSRPTGSTAPLSATEGEKVTFRPDVRGTYIIRLTPQTNNKQVIGVYDKRLYAGEYVGVGVLGDTTPRAPQCGTGFCHGPNTGDQRLNVTGDWLQSSHAQKMQKHLNGETTAFYSTSCLPCHSLGYNTHPEAVNNGFDDIANNLGYDLNNLAGLVRDAVNNNRENFTQLPSELRNHASVQCESCHGAGSQHPANLTRPDKGIDGANLGTNQCAQCHDSGNGRYQGFYEWSGSAHAETNQSSATVIANNTCRACHTGEGFVAVHVKGTTIPSLRNEDYHATTCSTCHDPHHSDHPAQLRVAGDFVIPSGERPYNSGSGGLCFRCHNSRIANGEATALSSFRGTHYSAQADMLLGTTGASFGLEFAANSAHAVVVPDSCVHCHMADGVGEMGDLTPPRVGDHTFAMRDHNASVHNAVNACATCHIGLETYDLRATGDYDGNGVVDGVQTEVAGLLAILRDGIIETMPGTSVESSGAVSINAANFANLSDNQKRALYNYNFVVNDGSMGIHNTAYTIQLLQRSYYGVHGRPITTDFPLMTLRGPVQDPDDPSKDGEVWVVY